MAGLLLFGPWTFHLCSLVTDESELLDDNAISLTSSDPATSALLAPNQEEQKMLDKDKEVEL